MVFHTRSKTKMVQVWQDKLLCPLMALSASLTNSLTIGLLFWAKQKRWTGLFTQVHSSSNFSLANVNIFAKRRVQRRTRKSLDKARQDRFVVEKHDWGALLAWRMKKKVLNEQRGAQDLHHQLQQKASTTMWKWLIYQIMLHIILE